MSYELQSLRIPTYDDLIIDGNRFSTYGVYVAGDKGMELDILPSKKVNTNTINGYEGESFVSSFFESRVFKLPFFIENINMLDEFKMLFNQRKPYWLHFDNAGLKLKVMLISGFNIKTYGFKAMFELEFEALDPYFYESVASTYEAINPTFIKYINNGNSESSPIYKVTGKGIVFVTVNGHAMAIRLNETIEETITINCKTFEAYDENKRNRIFDHLNYNFPSFNAGYNKIEVAGDCTKLIIQANSKWI